MSKADDTRLTILKKAFDLIYARGYQVTSVDDIIAETKVTKGAFYYHFKTKDAMGLAVIREVMYPGMHKALITPLLSGHDPVFEIHDMMKTLLLHNTFFHVRYGCPAVNLIEEMAPVSKPFQKALLALIEEWQETIASVIDNGKASGTINRNVNGKQVAYFISAGYGGVRNMGKLYGEACYRTYLKELKNYLNSLR
jgi:TetR/AcrR family transcriptional regulator, transcriptional repressor for nem operon